jgi:small-conductance mechanosensitive channel
MDMVSIAGNPVVAWLAATGIFVLVLGGLLLFRRVLRHRLEALAERRVLTGLVIAIHTVGRTRFWFLLIVAAWAGAQFLMLPERAEEWIGRIMLIGALVQAGLWTTGATSRVLDSRRQRELRENPAIVAAMDMVAFAVRLVVWSIVLLVLLDNLGVDITTLVAGLGIGGIAVALAAQNVLGDLFASLSIVLDKPFVVGDYLAVDDFQGSVEKVGIKTTRVRSLSGEQLIFPNNDLLGSRIRNYGRMRERRVEFKIGIAHRTPPENLAKVSALLREVVERRKSVRFDRAHFRSFGDFSLVFEVVYFVPSADFVEYADVQQEINIEILERLGALGVELAHPLQTLYLRRSA